MPLFRSQREKSIIGSHAPGKGNLKTRCGTARTLALEPRPLPFLLFDRRDWGKQCNAAASLAGQVRTKGRPLLSHAAGQRDNAQKKVIQW